MNDPAIERVRLDWRVARVAAASVVFLAMLPLISRGATAADGDVSVNFAAAAPYSYTHATGGGAWNDGTNAEDKDIREELEGGQFTRRHGDRPDETRHGFGRSRRPGDRARLQLPG